MQADDFKMVMNDDMMLMMIHLLTDELVVEIMENLQLNFDDFKMKMMKKKN